MDEINQEEVQETKVEQKKIKAKTTSIIVKVVACVFVGTCSILNWLKVIDAPVQDICIIGAFMVAAFGDVSINTFTDKFTKRGE